MLNKYMVRVLTVLLVLWVLPTVVFAEEIIAEGYCGESGNNLHWSLEANGQLTVAGHGAMKADERPWFDYGDLILSIVVEEGVTSIGSSAFDCCPNATTVELPDSLTSIGLYAFGHCESLEVVRIPANVTDISVVSFPHCTSLKSIEVDPLNVRYYSEDGVLFDSVGRWNIMVVPTLHTYPAGKMSESYRVPDGVMVIDHNAFQDSAVTEVILPDTMLVLDTGSFSGCKNLREIWVPDSVIAIGTYVFDGCTNLTDVRFPDHLNLTNGVFAGCKSLESFIVPSANITIPEHAFNGCRNLESIVIPECVKEIGTHAFHECSSLEQLNLPDELVFIGEYAFGWCSSLEELYIPNRVDTIEAGAFRGCNKLRSIRLPDNLSEISTLLFDDCNALESVVIPDSVTYIGYGAFADCCRLKNIYIPAGVAALDNYLFSGCEGLQAVFFYGNAPAFLVHTFYGYSGLVYYPVNNLTWTESLMQDYGGSIIWVPYNPNNPFTDVSLDSYYEESVIWAVENGITNGATATTFNPNGTCLRAHVVTFLHRAADNPAPASNKNPFTDVKSSDFFYKPVLWAVEKGITNGTTATTFGSYANCNRAAVVTFLWRAAGSPEPKSTNNPFVDVKTTDFFYKPVLWAVENGVTNGVDATHFGPATDCNRAQVVTFLYRAYN